MFKPMDLRGHTYGKLTPIELLPKIAGEKPKWLCRCSCGGTISVFAFNLRQGSTKQCEDCRHFKWTAEREQIVRTLRAQGETAKHIASVLGCSAYIVYSKLKQWKNDAARRAVKPDSGFRTYINSPCERKCLRCEKAFIAESRMNRLCRYCGPVVHGAAFV